MFTPHFTLPWAKASPLGVYTTERCTSVQRNSHELRGPPHPLLHTLLQIFLTCAILLGCCHAHLYVAQCLIGSALTGASRPEALPHHWTWTVKLVCRSQENEPKSFRDSSPHGSLLKHLSIFLSFPYPWCLFPVISHWTETETKTFLRFMDSVISQACLMSA